MAIKNGSKEGSTEFAKSARPFWAAFILSLENITSKIVKMQKSIAIKFLLNLKNTILILGIVIKSPYKIY